jgi:hypothetical protein
MTKRCPDHGSERVLIADDIDDYRRCRDIFIKPPEMPLMFNFYRDYLEATRLASLRGTTNQPAFTTAIGLGIERRSNRSSRRTGGADAIR